jgi:aminoglycoside phosphotransferase (APT) family kinase protein
MARFHYKIHKYSSDRLPTQKERFTTKMRKSSKKLGDKKRRILDYMDSLPYGNSVCHGDLHFKNIIISDKGPVAIDWNSGYRGNPLGDVARTCLMINLPLKSSDNSNILKMLSDYPRRLIYQTYLDEYMRLAKVTFEDIDAWMLPVAAARFKDKRPEEHKWLMDIIDKHLEKYNV